MFELINKLLNSNANEKEFDEKVMPCHLLIDSGCWPSKLNSNPIRNWFKLNYIYIQFNRVYEKGKFERVSLLGGLS